MALHSAEVYSTSPCPSRSPFGPWIARIGLNLALDRIRRRTVRDEVDDEILESVAVDDDALAALRAAAKQESKQRNQGNLYSHGGHYRLSGNFPARFL